MWTRAWWVREGVVGDETAEVGGRPGHRGSSSLC